jgi:uncharacterized protein
MEPFQEMDTESSLRGISRSQDIATATNAFLRHVFAWMFLGLAVTTGVAVWFHATGGVAKYFNNNGGVVIGVIIAQLALVFLLSFAINKIPAQLAIFCFLLYAALTGFVFALILDSYTDASIVGAFAGAAGVFGGMAIYGYATKRDLSKFGGILFGALLGLIVASVVFIFIPGSTFNLILGWAGVIIFAGLTAYDMQMIKEMGSESVDEGGQAHQKAAIFGALALYLNFINIFLSLLRIFGRD